jgi:hypothetical protein
MQICLIVRFIRVSILHRDIIVDHQCDLHSQTGGSPTGQRGRVHKEVSSLSIESFKILTIQVNLNRIERCPENKVMEISGPTTHH